MSELLSGGNSGLDVCLGSHSLRRSLKSSPRWDCLERETWCGRRRNIYTEPREYKHVTTAQEAASAEQAEPSGRGHIPTGGPQNLRKRKQPQRNQLTGDSKSGRWPEGGLISDFWVYQNWGVKYMSMGQEVRNIKSDYWQFLKEDLTVRISPFIICLFMKHINIKTVNYSKSLWDCCCHLFLGTKRMESWTTI